MSCRQACVCVAGEAQRSDCEPAASGRAGLRDSCPEDTVRPAAEQLPRSQLGAEGPLWPRVMHITPHRGRAEF